MAFIVSISFSIETKWLVSSYFSQFSLFSIENALLLQGVKRFCILFNCQTRAGNFDTAHKNLHNNKSKRVDSTTAACYSETINGTAAFSRAAQSNFGS